MALANDRTFYLVYDRTGTGEPVTGDMTTPPAIWEGFADLDDLMATPERATGYMVGGASARTQFLARYGASSTDQEATDCSAAIEGPPGAHDPHYAAMVAPLANQISFISSDAAHKARLSGATVLDNRLLIDALEDELGGGLLAAHNKLGEIYDKPKRQLSNEVLKEIKDNIPGILDKTLEK